MRDTILMDLDGTLLPFEQEEFIQSYFRLLCKELAPKGYAPEAVVKAVWAGTKSMIQNDGSVLNHNRFWDAFEACLGKEVRGSETTLDAFYENDFHQVKAVVRGESCAKELVATLRDKGYTVVLATNPLFPEVAVRSRLSWIGLSPEDFSHITHYRNSHYCKPNPRYYEEILQTVGKTPQQCVMIGNSVSEDMIAQTLGMDVFLVNTFTENPADAPTADYRQGTLADCLEWVAALPSVTE